MLGRGTALRNVDVADELVDDRLGAGREIDSRHDVVCLSDGRVVNRRRVVIDERQPEKARVAVRVRHYLRDNRALTVDETEDVPLRRGVVNGALRIDRQRAAEAGGAAEHLDSKTGES